MEKPQHQKKNILFQLVRWLVWLFYPKMKLEGTENLPEGASIIVGNHSQMNGPICSELYTPGKHYTWCIGEMMHMKTVPDYSYTDFWWNRKPKWIRWLYRILSYLIAPLAVFLFNNADTIAVYKDSRLIQTFRQTLEALKDGARVVIFPEHYVDYNDLLCDFQRNFVDVARQYYIKEKVCIPFVPMYLAPELKTIYFGKPIYYDPEIPKKEQMDKVCIYLMDSITDMARSLPRHRVVPYRNIPKKYYHYNREENSDKSGD